MPRYDEIAYTMKRISEDVDIMDILIQFEDILEKSGLYVYKNWESGEIVDGPHIEKHWVELTLMYPNKLMPEPEGALRLTKVGAKVYMGKDIYKEPRRVMGPSSVQDPVTKQAKLVKHKIWVVKIRLPKRLIDQEMEEYFGLKNMEMIVDVTDIDEVYDDDVVSGQPPEFPTEADEFDIDTTSEQLDNLENEL
jgi:hypothetical protein